MIPVNEPRLGREEKQYVLECLKTGWISSEGPFVKEFEEKFAARVEREFGIAVANGSAALEIAIAALDIKSGDEVIMPTFTIISCAGAVVKAGAKPVLVDSDPVTWNMAVEQIESVGSDCFTSRMVHVGKLLREMIWSNKFDSLALVNAGNDYGNRFFFMRNLFNHGFNLD